MTPRNGKDETRRSPLLDASTAQWRRDMHIVLTVIFPLLRAAQRVLLEVTPKPARYAGRLAAFGHVVFYGALDGLAGIGGDQLRHIGA